MLTTDFIESFDNYLLNDMKIETDIRATFVEKLKSTVSKSNVFLHNQFRKELLDAGQEDKDTNFQCADYCYCLDRFFTLAKQREEQLQSMRGTMMKWFNYGEPIAPEKLHDLAAKLHSQLYIVNKLTIDSVHRLPYSNLQRALIDVFIY